MPFRLTNHDRQNPNGPHFLTKFPKVQLEIARGRATHKMRQVEVPVYLIGTALDCDLVLGDPQFPEAHSYLLLTSGGLSLRYLGVGPEVLVNNRRIEAIELQDGDSIRSGDYEFLVHLTSPQRRGDETEGKTLRRGFGQTEASDSDELDIVRNLLTDIRDAVFPDHLGLRLYDEPEQSRQGAPRSARKASA